MVNYVGLLRTLIDIVYFLIGLVMDIVVFIKLAKPFKAKKDIVFFSFFYILIALWLICSLTDNINILLTLAQIVALYLYFGVLRKNNKKLILGAILFASVINQLLFATGLLINSFVTVLELNIWEETVDVVLNIVIIFVINKYQTILRAIMQDENSTIFIGILFYIYLSTSVINYYLASDRRPAQIIQVSIGLLVFQMIFAFLIYAGMVIIQQNLLDSQQQKAELEKFKQLKDYSTYLEKSEDELRSFRHDYRNMFNSLKLSAQEGNVAEVIEKLDDYTKTNLDSQALLKYKDINHVHVKFIKSIIISKLTEMYNLGIKYNFECRQEIKTLPQQLDELDLVRIIGITCDNAIEESKALQKKKLVPEIQIMFYAEKQNEFEYEIRNRTIAKQLSVQKMQRKGFTTKKDHSGLGLANIATIEDKYPDMSISYHVKDNWFDFYLVFDSNTED